MFIKKVAVNSGGKHCLALSFEGEVYSWGEAEDGKLGHGNRRQVTLENVIEKKNLLTDTYQSCCLLMNFSSKK